MKDYLTEQEKIDFKKFVDNTFKNNTDKNLAMEIVREEIFRLVDILFKRDDEYFMECLFGDMATVMNIKNIPELKFRKYDEEVKIEKIK